MNKDKGIYLVIFLLTTVLLAVSKDTLSKRNQNTGIQSYDKFLSNYKYPFEVYTYSFSSQGRDMKMAYMYLRPKKPQMGFITLLHGKNFNGAYWEETANLLHEKGFGILIPDQIGFGKSSKPVDYQYTFEVLAHNTKRLLEFLKIQSTHVIGHSMGGMLGSRFALLYPKLTRHLILVNPIGLENYLLYSEYKDVDFFYQNELKLTSADIISYQKKYYYDGNWNKEYAKFANPLIGLINGPDWKELAKISARVYDMIFTGSVIEDFPYFQIPVTLILGTRDRTGPGRNWMKPNINYELGRYDKLGNKVKNYNSKIEVIELKNIGHTPQIEDFGRFRKVLEGIIKQK